MDGFTQKKQQFHPYRYHEGFPFTLTILRSISIYFFYLSLSFCRAYARQAWTHHCDCNARPFAGAGFFCLCLSEGF